MSGNRVFLDTNLLVYLFTEDEPEKRLVAIRLMDEYQCTTGINNLNELANVLLRKMKVPHIRVIAAIKQILSAVDLGGLSPNLICSAISVSERYGYSFFDSLVISTALSEGASILYSEDMQHQQVIQETLTILNPFIQIVSETPNTQYEVLISGE